MSYYCQQHGWSSDYSPCPSCVQTITEYSGLHDAGTEPSGKECYAISEKSLAKEWDEPSGQGEETKEDILKKEVGNALRIDMSDKNWFVNWWLLLDPAPSIKRIYLAMDEYAAQQTALLSRQLLRSEQKNKELLEGQGANEQTIIDQDRQLLEARERIQNLEKELYFIQSKNAE